MALLDLQRGFVWEPGATQELIVSIANGYPAGIILRMREGNQAFAARAFEGGPKLNGYKHTFLVFDGQKRLTSLYHAFFGVGEQRYYLDLKKLIDGADFEDVISYERATNKRVKARDNFEHQARELILPLSVLKTGASGFLDWMLKAVFSKPADERTHMLGALEKINAHWIKAMDEYRFPVVTLSNETERDVLCAIMDRLGRGGTKLSVFELLAPRFLYHNINLGALWDRSLPRRR